MLIVCYILLMAAALSLLFLFEENDVTCALVALMLGAGLAGVLYELLPPEWFEASRFRRKVRRFLLLVLPCIAVCYKMVEWWLYPLRNKLMQAVAERWHRKD